MFKKLFILLCFAFLTVACQTHTTPETAAVNQPIPVASINPNESIDPDKPIVREGDATLQMPPIQTDAVPAASPTVPLARTTATQTSNSVNSNSATTPHSSPELIPSKEEILAVSSLVLPDVGATYIDTSEKQNSSMIFAYALKSNNAELGKVKLSVKRDFVFRVYIQIPFAKKELTLNKSFKAAVISREVNTGKAIVVTDGAVDSMFKEAEKLIEQKRAGTEITEAQMIQFAYTYCLGLPPDWLMSTTE